MLKEMAQHGVDISHLEYSRPPGGHQRNIERGINTGIQKWKETMIHPDTGKDVIVIPFTFDEFFPEKDIIRGYLMDMNSGRFSNCQLAQLECRRVNGNLIRFIVYIFARDFNGIFNRIRI